MEPVQSNPDYQDLYDDVLIETRQAVEMCSIYRDILKTTMDAFSSVISNNVNNVVKRLTEELFLEVRAKGEYLRTFISKMKGVEAVTGMGLMLGVAVRSEKSARKLAEECLEKGLMILTAHDRLRLLPPLNITKAEMNEGLEILNGVLENAEK